MNALTEQLLHQGYTQEYHPPNVKWSYWGQFEFTPGYLRKTVWESPCGLLETGGHFVGMTTSWQGIDFMPENNNPLGCCPYRRERECAHLLPTCLAAENCIFHFSRRPFDYEQSCKKIEDGWERIRHEAWEKVTTGYGHCGCMHWDQPSRSYIPKYNVDDCIRSGCQNAVCAITLRPRNLEKVNIFFDVLRVRRYSIGFAEYCDKDLRKGERQFKRPVARTDAENWLKINGEARLGASKDHADHVKMHGSTRDHPGPKEVAILDDSSHISVTVQNVRIVKRYSRDLLQDLRDVAEGLHVTHASDLKKEAAAAKRERGEKRKVAKEKAARRKMVDGWRQIVATGLMPDGSPCTDDMLAFYKKELAAQGVEEHEQISIWRKEDG